MDLLKLMSFLKPYVDEEVKVCDLSTDEGLKEFNEQLDQLENNYLDDLSTFGINGKDWIDNMRDLGKKIHAQHKAENTKKFVIDKDAVKQAVNQMKEDEKVSNFKNEFKKPSELLSIDQKLKLHKIVQEYVDTMIKPFNNGALSNQQINDAYAGLYEFAAWVMNK